MNNWRLAVIALACITAAQASFNCPEDSHSFYHADVSTGCQVYHFCENSQLQTFTCPAGQAFNHETSQCEDASIVNCYETMGHHSHHHHHKRSVEVEEYHTIDIQEAKEKIIETYKAIKPIVADAVRSVAPTIYDKFDTEYAPAIKKFKTDIMPFVKEKVIPQIRKYHRFGSYVFGQVVEKVRNSYHRSNSTHITIASFSDLAKDITSELKPLLDLGKFLSDKAVKRDGRRRYKRHLSTSASNINFKRRNDLTEIRDVDEWKRELFLSYNISIPKNIGENPVEDNFVRWKLFAIDFFYPRIFPGIFGVIDRGDIVIYDLFLPYFYYLMENEETRTDIIPVIVWAYSSFNPVLQKISEAQINDTLEDEEALVKIPVEVYMTALGNFLNKTEGFMRKASEVRASAHKQYELHKEHTPSIIVFEKRVKSGYYPEVQDLKTELNTFLSKHRRRLYRSSGEKLDFYNFKEIMKDFNPVRMAIYKILKQFYCSNKLEKTFLFFMFFYGDRESVRNICD